jgi:hypothetical protein
MKETNMDNRRGVGVKDLTKEELAFAIKTVLYPGVYGGHKSPDLELLLSTKEELVDEARELRRLLLLKRGYFERAPVQYTWRFLKHMSKPVSAIKK